ncbi:hypothetical protein HDV06_002168 [Boothiomyces sp. JEL0866]|nr:hypothetical protein HDV06_002168 [Boothiomyces sp. JEL0866]
MNTWGTITLIPTLIGTLYQCNYYLQDKYRTKSHYKVMLVYLLVMGISIVVRLLKFQENISKIDEIIYAASNDIALLGISNINMQTLFIFSILDNRLAKYKMILKLNMVVVVVICVFNAMYYSLSKLEIIPFIYNPVARKVYVGTVMIEDHFQGIYLSILIYRSLHNKAKVVVDYLSFILYQFLNPDQIKGDNDFGFNTLAAHFLFLTINFHNFKNLAIIKIKNRVRSLNSSHVDHVVVFSPERKLYWNDVLAKGGILKPKGSFAPATESGNTVHNTRIADRTECKFSMSGITILPQYQNLDKEPRNLLLNHPHGFEAQFILTDQELLQIQSFRNELSSFVVGNTIIENGDLKVATPYDPLYLMIPVLMKSNDRFCTVEDILHEQGDLMELTNLPKFEERLKIVCEYQFEVEQHFYRISNQKLQDWLKLKTEKLISNMPDMGILGEFVSPEATDLEKREFAYNILKDNLTEPVANELFSALGLEKLKENKPAYYQDVIKKKAVDELERPAKKPKVPTKKPIANTSRNFKIDSYFKKVAKPA